MPIIPAVWKVEAERFQVQKKVGQISHLARPCLWTKIKSARDGAPYEGSGFNLQYCQKIKRADGGHPLGLSKFLLSGHSLNACSTGSVHKEHCSCSNQDWVEAGSMPLCQHSERSLGYGAARPWSAIVALWWMVSLKKILEPWFSRDTGLD